MSTDDVVTAEPLVAAHVTGSFFLEQLHKREPRMGMAWPARRTIQDTTDQSRARPPRLAGDRDDDDMTDESVARHAWPAARGNIMRNTPPARSSPPPPAYIRSKNDRTRRSSESQALAS